MNSAASDMGGVAMVGLLLVAIVTTVAILFDEILTGGCDNEREQDGDDDTDDYVARIPTDQNNGGTVR